MQYTNLICKPEYVNQNGSNVFRNGSTVIEGIEHMVKNGYVFCNASLNHKSWGTTEHIGICEKCFPEKFTKKVMECKQLTLF